MSQSHRSLPKPHHPFPPLFPSPHLLQTHINQMRHPTPHPTPTPHPRPRSRLQLRRRHRHPPGKGSPSCPIRALQLGRIRHERHGNEPPRQGVSLHNPKGRIGSPHPPPNPARVFCPLPPGRRHNPVRRRAAQSLLPWRRRRLHRHGLLGRQGRQGGAEVLQTQRDLVWEIRKVHKGNHRPPFGTGSAWSKAKQLTSNHFLASGLTGPRPIPLFGTSFGRTGAYTPFWLQVFGEPRPKIWL